MKDKSTVAMNDDVFLSAPISLDELVKLWLRMLTQNVKQVRDAGRPTHQNILRYHVQLGEMSFWTISNIHDACFNV